MSPVSSVFHTVETVRIALKAYVTALLRVFIQQIVEHTIRAFRHSFDTLEMK